MNNKDENPLAIGVGVCNRSESGVLLDVWFPSVIYQPPLLLTDAVRNTLSLPKTGTFSGQISAEQTALLIEILKQQDPTAAEATAEIAENNDTDLLLVLLHADEAPNDTASVYLKLHLLSLRHAKPNQLNLNGIFGLLPTVAWTSEGAVLPEELPKRKLDARQAGRYLYVHSVDKFPPMANYVTPSGVRIADAHRIRLGAHLGEGTTVMHEGFVNFNAGTLGHAMVEGRISQGVTVNENSDLGGSASTMGTLAGGGNIIISIGKNCLIGANAGTGIPLGDNCTIEAGLYITAGTLVAVMDKDRHFVKTVKARELAGQSDMLFIRNSDTGRVECRINKTASDLNLDLHAHN